MLLHYYSCSQVGNWDEEAIQALRRATRAGVTRGELGGEPQSSSSSLEATSDGAAELWRGQARHQLVGPGAIRGREGLKQLQFVLPAGEELPSEHLVGAGREQGRTRPGSVRLSVQSQLSLERKAMMCRQLVGAIQRPITATRSRVEEGLELRPDSLEGLHFLIITFLSITAQYVPASLRPIS